MVLVGVISDWHLPLLVLPWERSKKLEIHFEEAGAA